MRNPPRDQINSAQNYIANQSFGRRWGTGSGSAADLDCDTLEAIGYWSPVTDGASNIIYTGGEVVVAFTCTS